MKKAEGNRSKAALPPAPLRGQLGKPERPKDLKGSAAAFWDFFAAQLELRGGFELAHGPALADFCTCMARVKDLEAQIEKQGVLIKGQRGMVKHPGIQLSRNYRSQAQKYIEYFGFAPVPQGRVDLKPVEDEDDEDGLLD